ncbi:MAG: hypothetical protein ACREKL_14395, partial [Chthoniobacterales bacterium]
MGDRADAEYFGKENLAIEKALRDHEAVALRELCTLAASAFYPPATDLYEEGDVPFARCVDCIDYPVITLRQDDRFVRVPKWFIEQCAQIDTVTRGDIILTKVGSPCFASVVEDYDLIALSRTVLGLVKIHDVDPHYLVAFLRGRYGFTQLLRQRELTIQYQLTLERVRDVLVYRASEKLQLATRTAMCAYTSKLTEADNRVRAVEDNLLDAIGFTAWHPPEPLTYTRSASEVLEVERFDADYFAPAKFDALARLGEG